MDNKFVLHGKNIDVGDVVILKKVYTKKFKMTFNKNIKINFPAGKYRVFGLESNKNNIVIYVTLFPHIVDPDLTFFLGFTVKAKDVKF